MPILTNREINRQPENVSPDTNQNSGNQKKSFLRCKIKKKKMKKYGN